jgi:ubiquinone/menaquinone biosynthesis C-methylase UbiE
LSVPTQAEIDRIRAAYARRDRSGRDRRYSLFEPAHLFQTQSLERAVLGALRAAGLDSLSGLRILDVGCGGGGWLKGLVRYGAEASRLTGIDLREKVLVRGREGPELAVAAADSLPFSADSFDIVSQLTMMSSILDRAMRGRIAGEMLRVLRPGGLMLWYDFTVNPFNPDVAGIRPAELRVLFPATSMHWQRVTLAPPVTRILAPRAWMICEALERVPWFRTHLLAMCRKPGDG